MLSILLFIFYYVINNIGSKMARDGIWIVLEGMWFSSAVLTVMSSFLTYKAVNDSVILNADTYANTLKNLIGKRDTRKVEKKEVIIYSPDYKTLIPRLDALAGKARIYLLHYTCRRNYIDYWKEGGKDNEAEQLVAEIESIVEELSNSDQNLVLNKLMDYPIIGGYKPLITHPNTNLRLAVGLFLPISLPVYLFATYQRKLLRQDIKTAEKVSEELKDMIANLTNTNP